MAESSWPGEAPTVVTEHQFERLMSGYYQSGLIGDPSVRPIFADSTGLQVKVRQERYALVRGFVWYSGPTEFTLAISSNTSGATRVDLVVLRLDRSDWTVTAQVIEGTPGGGAPAITSDEGDTGTWDFVAAVVTVPNGTTTTITAGMVAGTPTYLMPQMLASDSGTHPVSNNPPIYIRYALNVDRLLLVRPAGTIPLWQDSGEVELSNTGSGWSGDQDTVIRQVGVWVWLRLPNFIRTGGTVSSGSDSLLPGVIPSSMRINRDVYVVGRTNGHNTVRMRVNHSGRTPAGRFVIVGHPGFSSGDFINATTVSWPVV